MTLPAPQHPTYTITTAGTTVADGHPFTADDPQVLTDDGWRVHRSDVIDPRSGFYGHEQQEQR